MKHVALFAGIGGFMYAAKKAGIENVWANELEEKCCETLALNFPDTQISRKSVANLDTKDIHEIPDGIDLMTAGFPCQSFSQAGGSFKAFDDPRGKLFFDIPRVIGLMKAPPKVVLLENVPNLKNFDKGSLLRTVITEMKFAGYWVKEQHAQILNSAEYGGTPQRRERLFIVCAHKKYFKHNPFNFSYIEKRPCPPLFDFIDREKMPGDDYYLSSESKYFKMIDKIASREGRDRLFQIRRVVARACPPGICPTLTANMGEGGHNVPFVYDDFGLRRLTEDECLKMQGFDVSQMQFPNHLFAKDIRKMAGNAVSVNTVYLIILEIQKQLFAILEGKNGSEKGMALSA